MTTHDVPQAALVMDVALMELAERHRRPHHSPTFGAERERVGAMMRQLLTTDPHGAFVAIDPRPEAAAQGREFVGFTISCVRDTLWTLPCLFVAPGHQGRGIGSTLLHEAVSYGQHCTHRAIVATANEQAVSTYLSVPGIELHPAVTATGTPALIKPDVTGVRAATAPDLDVVARVDARVRGASRLDDIRFLLDGGAMLLVGKDGDAHGYAVVRPGATVVDGAPVLLAADTDELAARLLRASLMRAGGPVEVYGLTSAHQWAMRVCREAGLNLTPGQTVFRTQGWPQRATLLSGTWF